MVLALTIFLLVPDLKCLYSCAQDEITSSERHHWKSLCPDRIGGLLRKYEQAQKIFIFLNKRKAG